MIACTSPSFTTRSMPFRIFLPPTSTWRFLISSIQMSLPVIGGIDPILTAHVFEGRAVKVAARYSRDDAERIGVRIVHHVDLGLGGKGQIAQLFRARIDNLMRLGARGRGNHVAGADR